MRVWWTIAAYLDQVDGVLDETGLMEYKFFVGAVL
jgi:hypothetical protein